MSEIQKSTPQVTQGLGEMGLQDYIALFKRRKYWFVFPALATAIAICVTGWRMPNMYRCQAVILVQPQKVPDSYVKAMPINSWPERLSTIYQEVTSPARLKPLVDSMNLFPEMRKQPGGEQDAVAAMEKAINVEQVSALGTIAAAFRITYKGNNAAQVAQVTNQLAAMFIEENLKVREEQSYGTADFIQTELEKTEKELQDKGKELAEVHSRYSGDMPQAAQFHIQEAETLRQQLQIAQQQLHHDQQQKADLQTLVSTTAPTVDLDLGASSSPQDVEAQDLETRLNSLRSRYGPNYPDVKKLQAELDQAKAKHADQPAQPAAAPAVRKMHNPVIEAQMEQLDQDIQKQTQLVTQIQSQIEAHLAKIQASPEVSQNIESVQRDNDALQHRYEALVEKKMSAETATAMESREKSERFVLLDTAQVPKKPYSPNRPLVVCIAIVMALLLGTGAALVREVIDDAVRNEREAEHILSAPVLSGVPEILTSNQMLHNAVRLSALAVVTIVVAVGMGIGIANLSQSLL